MKTYLPLIAVFASTFAYAQLADSTGAGRLHMSPPIASEGGSCNTSEVKSDANGNILYCQSGIWKPTKDTGGKGMSGIWSKYKGMSASCVTYAGGYNGTYKASVSFDGQLTLSVVNTQGKVVVQCQNVPTCSIGTTTVSINSYGVFGSHTSYTGDEGGTSQNSQCSQYFPAF